MHPKVGFAPRNGVEVASVLERFSIKLFFYLISLMVMHTIGTDECDNLYKSST